MLQGAVLPRESEVSLNDLKKESVTVTEVVKGKKLHKTYDYYVRKAKPAYQSINITKEAYESWVKEVPEFIKDKKHYEKLNKKDKVIVHLKEIAANLNGRLVDFVIYPD